MRKAAAGILLGLGAAAVVLALAAMGAFEQPELWAYDLRVRGAADPAAVHPDISLVLIDDQTIRDFEPLFGRWPWPRAAQSLLFSFLNRAPARVITYDVGIWERDPRGARIGDSVWSGADSDAALVAEVKRGGNVVMLADAVFAGAAEQANRPAEWSDPGFRLDSSIEARPALLPPFQELADAAKALGHNFLALDPGGSARRVPPFLRIGDRFVPALGVATALAAAAISPSEVRVDGRDLVIRDRRVPLSATRVRDRVGSDGSHDQLSMLINYRAAADQTSYPVFEARHLLQSELQIQDGAAPALDPATFRNRIVMIGASASGTFDVFQTPFASAAMPGVQVHAAVADSILSNRFIRPLPGWITILSVLAGAVAVGTGAVLLSYRVAAVGTAALLVLTWLLLAQLFRAGLWANAVQPLAAMGVALFAGTAYRYFVEDREKRKVRKLFGQYVSRDVFEQLMADPERATLGGHRRQMSVLFSDIRGFTTVTEQGDPEALVEQLNEYFSRMVEIVFRHHGTVDKFVGDMVMALFGAPLDDPAHARHAVEAATEMVRELGALNARWAADGRTPLDIGIGINSGEMIAGNIGSSRIMSYTVIGDNVNLGARLESLNKDYGTRIIISDATRTQLPAGFDLRPLGDVVVKGKTRPVAIFEVPVASPLPAVNEETHL